MTREQIELLPAGREMDTLIAEKVFGWKHYDDELWQRMRAWLIHRRELWEDSPDRLMICPDGYDRWPNFFSTDIRAAWDVVENLKHKGFNFGLREDGLRSYAGFARRPGTNFTGQGGTPTVAICRAALVAVFTCSDSIEVTQ